MSEPGSSGTQRTILTVDDDEGVTLTFARMPRIDGYAVPTANNTVSTELKLEAPPGFEPPRFEDLVGRPDTRQGLTPDQQ